MASWQFAIQESVQRGLWRDHDAQRTQILMGEEWASFWTSLIAAWLALGAGYTFDILKALLVPLLAKYLHGEEDERRERSRMLPHRHIEETDPETIAEVFQASSNCRALLSKIYNYLRGRHSRYGGWAIFLGLIFIGCYIGWVIVGVSVSDIQTGNVALWASDHCGLWLFDDEHAGEEAATRATVRDRSKESRAGEYAKACYTGGIAPDGSVARSTDSCKLFYQPFIPFVNRTSYQCPFQDHHVCAPGVPSISFSTGLVHAGQIGVNDADPYKFRRNTTCAPLNTGDEFVRQEEGNGTTTFYYYYGKIVDGDSSTDYTFSSAGDPFDVLAPTYNVSVYTTSWYPELDYWAPIPGLTPPPGSTITILFISALHILYLDSSADPIFPADEKYYFEGEANPWYYKSDPKSRVMACIDTHELCTPDEKSCWSMTDTRNNLPPSYWLMKLALESSNIYDAIVRRLGTALIAQERVSQSLSRALGDGHWKSEAARLFATSLARIQFDALAIASGEDSDQEGYIDMTPEEAGNLCGLFKFKSSSYKNLDLAWAILLGLLIPLLILLSFQEVRSWAVWACSVLEKRFVELCKARLQRLRDDAAQNGERSGLDSQDG